MKKSTRLQLTLDSGKGDYSKQDNHSGKTKQIE